MSKEKIIKALPENNNVLEKVLAFLQDLERNHPELFTKGGEAA